MAAPTSFFASGLNKVPSAAFLRCSLNVRTADRNARHVAVANNAAIAKQVYFPG